MLKSFIERFSGFVYFGVLEMIGPGFVEVVL